jgi:hypothetical protein
MLLDRYRELLTAYVDGELSSRQRRHVVRLLHRSPEARRLLDQLQQDACALRHLPRPRLTADLTGPVLHTIRERRLSLGQRFVAKASVASAWMGPLASYAAAAAVLLILGAASYLYFAASLVQPAKLEMAQTKTMTPDLLPRSKQVDSSSAKEENPRTASVSHEPTHTKPDSPAVVKPPLVVKKDKEKTLPLLAENVPPPPKEESALTDRLEMFQLDRVPDTLPVVVKVSDLDREARRKELLAELGKDGSFRIELPCKHGSKAFERVQHAAQTIHLGLIVEKQAQERIKQRWRTNYILYIENLTPEELTRFVQQIGVEDRKSSAGKPAEAQIDRLVLTRMTAQQRKELSTLLGIDPTTTAPSANGPLGTDLRKPLSDLTAQQLSRALAGQGGTPRPEAGKPAVKPPDHFALVLAYNPVRPAPGSEEIKRFLESRKPARLGTIRVLLVLRG